MRGARAGGMEGLGLVLGGEHVQGLYNQNSLSRVFKTGHFSVCKACFNTKQNTFHGS